PAPTLDSISRSLCSHLSTVRQLESRARAHNCAAARASIRATARERKIMKLITIAAIVLIAPALAACGQGHSETKAAAPPPPQVTVAKPVARQVAAKDEYVGRFVAIESVE